MADPSLEEGPWLPVGLACRQVDVPVGTTLSGYAARTTGSTGVHDPCTVRALAVGDTCWVSVDVCALHEDTCSEIAAVSGGPRGPVAVVATHTHAGPACTPGRLSGDDIHVRRGIVSAAGAAISAARAAREPMLLRHGAARGAGVAVNRRSPADPIDPPIDLVSFERADGSVAGWLATYPCHPVVLSADNLEVSGDYPHFLRRELERSSPGSIALFLPGTAGDVNNGHSAEASFKAGPHPGRTIEEAERIGAHLAQVARTAPRGVVAPPPADRLPIPGSGRAWGAAEELVTLRLATLDDEPPASLARRWLEAQRAVGTSEAEVLRSWVTWASRRADHEPMTWAARVSCVRWGSLTLVGVPGEPFLSFTAQVRERVSVARAERGHPAGPVLVTGYTNGCPGYLPDASAYDHGGYEVVDAHRYYGMPAPFARGSAEALATSAVRLALET